MTHPYRQTLSAAALALLLVGGCAQQPAQAEPQPQMRAALNALLEAERHLSNASHDKGGHRVKALEAVRAAIRQTRKGIRFDNRH